jgi:hypothetical protein
MKARFTEYQGFVAVEALLNSIGNRMTGIDKQFIAGRHLVYYLSISVHLASFWSLLALMGAFGNNQLFRLSTRTMGMTQAV